MIFVENNVSMNLNFESTRNQTPAPNDRMGTFPMEVPYALSIRSSWAVAPSVIENFRMSFFEFNAFAGRELPE